MGAKHPKSLVEEYRNEKSNLIIPNQFKLQFMHTMFGNEKIIRIHSICPFSSRKLKDKHMHFKRMNVSKTCHPSPPPPYPQNISLGVGCFYIKYIRK